MLNKLKDFFNKYKWKIIYTALTCLMFVFLCFSIHQCNTYKRMNDNNITALTDTINLYKSKNGNIIAEKTTLYATIKDLKKINDSLYNVVKDINIKNPDNIVYVNTTIEYEKHDTLFLINNDTIKNTCKIEQKFDFTNKYRSLQGNVYYYRGNTQDTLGINISKDLVNVDFTTILKDNKIYISSSNPYVKYNDIISINTKQNSKNKRFGVGPMIGVGINHKLQFTPFIGVGLTYNIFQF